MLQKQLGFSLDDLEGIGDVAVFASGESLVELQVGGIVEVPDAATREQAAGGDQPGGPALRRRQGARR